MLSGKKFVWFMRSVVSFVLMRDLSYKMLIISYKGSPVT
jgi:hypothetical protein